MFHVIRLYSDPNDDINLDHSNFRFNSKGNAIQMFHLDNDSNVRFRQYLKPSI